MVAPTAMFDQLKPFSMGAILKDMTVAGEEVSMGCGEANVQN